MLLLVRSLGWRSGQSAQNQATLKVEGMFDHAFEGILGAGRKGLLFGYELYINTSVFLAE